MRHKHSHNGRQKAIGCLDRLLARPEEQEFADEQLKLWYHEDFRGFWKNVIMPMHVEPEVLPAEEEFATLTPDAQVREMMRLTLGIDKPTSDVDALEARRSQDVQKEPTEQTPAD